MRIQAIVMTGVVAAIGARGAMAAQPAQAAPTTYQLQVIPVASIPPQYAPPAQQPAAAGQPMTFTPLLNPSQAMSGLQAGQPMILLVTQPHAFPIAAPPPPPYAPVAAQAPTSQVPYMGKPAPQAPTDPDDGRAPAGIRDVDAYVELSHQVARDAIQTLTRERDATQLRLEKIESDLRRWKKLIGGLEPEEAPSVPEIPPTPQVSAGPQSE